MDQGNFIFFGSESLKGLLVGKVDVQAISFTAEVNTEGVELFIVTGSVILAILTLKDATTED